MRLHTPVLTETQRKTIHRSALRVLAEVGVKVEHARLRDMLTRAGGREFGDIVRFVPDVVERHIAEAPKTPMGEIEPSVAAHVEVVASAWLNPATSAMERFDEQRLAQYVDFARHLSPGCHAGLLTVPFTQPDLPAEAGPLAERLMGWKWGYAPGGSVIDTRICRPLLELCRSRAAQTGKPLREVFNACGYLLSPLRLAEMECEQLLFFHDQGLSMGLGQMPIQGATAPVTLAGTLTLSIAEELFLLILRRAFDPTAAMSLWGTPQTLDMRHAVACFGRPQRQHINIAMAEMARFYGCARGAHCGLSDAMTPGHEAAAQKSISTLMAALTTGRVSIVAGLLGIDEVCSPVQLLLDIEMAEELNQLLRLPTIDECAVDEIAEMGPGGSFVGSDLTAQRYKEDLPWLRTWSHRTRAAWQAAGMPREVDVARDAYEAFIKDWHPRPAISVAEERELRAVIRAASLAWRT